MKNHCSSFKGWIHGAPWGVTVLGPSALQVWPTKLIVVINGAEVSIVAPSPSQLALP